MASTDDQHQAVGAAKTVAKLWHRRMHTGNLPVKLLQKPLVKSFPCRVRGDLCQVRMDFINYFHIFPAEQTSNERIGVNPMIVILEKAGESVL